jgi:hypothetical protein
MTKMKRQIARLFIMSQLQFQFILIEMSHLSYCQCVFILFESVSCACVLEHRDKNVAGWARVAAMGACDKGSHHSWSGNVNKFKEKSHGRISVK